MVVSILLSINLRQLNYLTGQKYEKKNIKHDKNRKDTYGNGDV